METTGVKMKVNDLFDLRKKIAIVTGGTGHLGYSISESLAEAGANVILLSRSLSKARKKSKELQINSKGKIMGLSCDILDSESIKRCFKNIENEFSKIDILVNNASTLPVGNFEKTSEKEWLSGIDSTIMGFFDVQRRLFH